MNLTEDDPLTTKKFQSNFYDLDEDMNPILDDDEFQCRLSDHHIVCYEGNKIYKKNDPQTWFQWIECNCGLTGICQNGKDVWNEYNFCKRLEKTVYKN